MASVTITEARKTYPGGLEVIKGVSIAIGDGELIVFVGPSGCGKSTLLRMVAGLETITAGTISIGERVVNELEPAERDIAMVFQNYALYPHMTVYDNLAYGLRNRKTPRPEIDARVAEAARMLQIEPYLDRKPRALSGGQRQRVAMGRAIVRQPSVYLFDEPLSNLDAKLRVSMRGEIRLLQRRLGVTSIYVTHDQLEAMTLADRLVVINGGLIEQMGTPLDIYHWPATTFVAGFLGSPAMNLVQAIVDGEGVKIGATPLCGRPQTAAQGRVTLGFRAEEVPHPTTNGVGAPLRVTLVEDLGAQRLVHGTIEDQTMTLAVPPGAPLAPELRVTFDPARLHFFDPATGARLT